MKPFRFLLFASLLLASVGCMPEIESQPVMPPQGEQEEATSLLGTPLFRPTLSAARQATLQANLDSAQAAFDANPDDVNTHIWLGRRQAYLWRYQDAIRTFSRAIERFPEVPHLYRHRGHRYITVRQLDEAIADFERAAALITGTADEVEPDGAPNAAGIPRSTLHTNIWYHLGLAYYLKGDFEQALRAYQQGLAASPNDDMYVATADWLYMTLRRLGREAEAAAVLQPIHADMEILENDAYLRRLQMYQGHLAPDSLLLPPTGADPALTFATQGYGVGNWFLYNGDPSRARDIFARVLDSEYWAAFGYLAAEAELARMQAAEN